MVLSDATLAATGENQLKVVRSPPPRSVWMCDG